MKSLFQFLLSLLTLALFAACTENPFGKDEISSGTREVRGMVALDDRANPAGAYVWLERFDLGTRADANGSFRISLPPPAAQGGSTNGVFNLYFYVANYLLTSAPVVTQEGAFVYGKGEINNNGELNAPRVMTKFLNITVQVTPNSVSPNFAGTVNVDVVLQAPRDTATVKFPTSTGNPLGAIMLKRVGSEDVYVFSSLTGQPLGAILVIGRNQRVWNMSFSLANNTLPVGAYEVIPHMIISHETIPADLLNNLTRNFTEPGLGYLNLPMQRNGGGFEIK